MMGTAIILTDGCLDHSDAKTAHGLIRGTERFEIVAVIDSQHAGRDAGEVLDGVHRGIPVYETLDTYLRAAGKPPDYCIIGLAVSGGRLNARLQTLLLEAVGHGISIVNGLHQQLGDFAVFREAARTHGVHIIDIRKPKPFEQLHYWTGRIFEVKTPRLAVLGTDCAMGKRTTCRMIVELCRRNGIKAEMIYTGQTGWLQGNAYGFILDATANDFVSGELETAIVTCAQEASPDLILIEGQSGLRNPSGPCGAEMIVSGNAKGVILQHAPGRIYFDGLTHLGCRIPDIQEEIDMIGMYGARTLALTLNGESCSPDELTAHQQRLQKRLRIPVVKPLQEGVEALLAIIRDFMQA
jgi:uncharacterized NAD-dependent epimerase/dehydratase family protein